MKRLLQLLPLVAIITTASISSANAQVSVSVNIGSQPMWGPAGYSSVNYYYLPDIECYYYVPRQQFVYMNAGNWVFSANLPSRYSGYDLYGGYKVVCNGPRPYTHFSEHRVSYARYRGYRGHQPVLRDCGPGRGRGDYYDGPRGPRGPRGGHHRHGHDRGHRGHDRW